MIFVFFAGYELLYTWALMGLWDRAAPKARKTSKNFSKTQFQNIISFRKFDEDFPQIC